MLAVIVLSLSFQVTVRAWQGFIFWGPVAAEVLPGWGGWSSMPSLPNDLHIQAIPQLGIGLWGVQVRGPVLPDLAGQPLQLVLQGCKVGSQVANLVSCTGYLASRFGLTARVHPYTFS